MQDRILTREPLTRFLTLTLTRADARLRAPRRERREHFFFSRCCGRCQHSDDIVGQSRRERSLKGRRERFSGLSKKCCQEGSGRFFPPIFSLQKIQYLAVDGFRPSSKNLSRRFFSVPRKFPRTAGYT